MNRGLSEPEAIGGFLEPRLKQLADPFLLPNMGMAVDRLFRARSAGEPLVIFGDYDVDGVASTALLTETLRALGWTVDCYLPHRLDEGYGLSQDGVENCLRKFPVTLMLAVDCGSTAVGGIAWLRQKGVDVLVLDHHQVSSPAPAAMALVNPHWEAAPAADARTSRHAQHAEGSDSLSSLGQGGEGRGEEECFKVAPLPNPLPARSSRGEGAGASGAGMSASAHRASAVPGRTLLRRTGVSSHARMRWSSAGANSESQRRRSVMCGRCWI